jgi:hypothetical protein
MNAGHRYGVEAHRSEGLPGGRIMADMRQMNTSPRANLPLSWAFDKRIAATILREHEMRPCPRRRKAGQHVRRLAGGRLMDRGARQSSPTLEAI